MDFINKVKIEQLITAINNLASEVDDLTRVIKSK